MNHCGLKLTAVATIVVAALNASAFAATSVQIGNSGKTFASSAATCAVQPATGLRAATVQAGLFNPTHRAEAEVRLNGARIGEVEASHPVADLWLVDGTNTVVVALNRRTVDTYVQYCSDKTNW